MSAQNMMMVGMHEESGKVELQLYGQRFLAQVDPNEVQALISAARRISMCVNTLAEYTMEEIGQNVVQAAFLQGVKKSYDKAQQHPHLSGEGVLAAVIQDMQA